MLKEYYVAIAIIALAIVLAFIPAAFAASNENQPCVGNPHTNNDGNSKSDPHSNDIQGNIHRSGGNHHCPGQK
jgi:hypothetical protein